jgi:hypothetical protein
MVFPITLWKSRQTGLRTLPVRNVPKFENRPTGGNLVHPDPPKSELFSRRTPCHVIAATLALHALREDVDFELIPTRLFIGVVRELANDHVP